VADPPDPLVARLRAAGCVYAEDEAAALRGAAGTPVELESMTTRRAAGEPLEQVIGWAEFCGLRIRLEPGVFVPRRRSELLVREALRVLALPVIAARSGAPRTGSGDGPLVVVDLCCGSGALGAAVADGARRSGIGPVELHAADVDPVAVRCARANLAASDGRVVCGDLDAPLPARLRGHVVVLVANVPYVPTTAIPAMPPEAREHEPHQALDGGEDGLDVLRRVATLAPGWLAPGGHLVVETSRHQRPEAIGVLEGAGLTARSVDDEDLGATVVLGRRAGADSG